MPLYNLVMVESEGKGQESCAASSPIKRPNLLRRKGRVLALMRAKESGDRDLVR